MLFQSAGFLFLFLPIFLLTVALVPVGATKSIALLLLSYAFYSGGEPFFILILLVSSITDYFAALNIYKSDKIITKRSFLIVSVFVNLGLLAFYKYGAWVIPNISTYLEMAGIPVPDSSYFRGFILPAGISFYTFQSMSYSIDVYRGEVKPVKNFIGFCNYVAYLPQLIAGPIERFNHLYPQILDFRNGVSVKQWSAGVDRIALGLAQKLLIADSCGFIVDRLINGIPSHSFITAWSIAIGFGMQIYYDFAAYTHIAIGISLLLGIELQENFDSPYQGKNIQEFWRRWHMTLSRWFRDYLYIPLGGSREGNIRTFFNILITFILIGLWHGAGLNFILWGALHGIALGLYHIKKELFPAWTLNLYVAILITFIFVHFTWIPFRAENIIQTIQIWGAMIGQYGFAREHVSYPDLIFLLLVTTFTLLVPNASKRWPGSSGWTESTALCVLAIFAIFNSSEITKFIYFQF